MATRAGDVEVAARVENTAPVEIRGSVNLVQIVVAAKLSSDGITDKGTPTRVDFAIR